jgi:hypothetical protein
MKLVSPELLERFAEIGNQYENENPLFIAKFFNPCGSQTYYASEYDPETKTSYGYITGMYVDEWGTFSITELEALQLPFGLKIERDLYFKELHFNELVSKKRFQDLNTQNKEKDLDANQNIEL